MSRILVTGATGQLGRETLKHLLERRPAADLLGLARNPEGAAELAALGVEIRKGDYNDRDSVLRACDGIDRLLLVPTHAFTDRVTQHANVISAAREAGVERIVITPIIRKEGSGLVLPEVTDSDRLTEQALITSGLTFTILRHPPFLESFTQYALVVSPGSHAGGTAVRITAGAGKAATATRGDLAEAQAAVLAEDGHTNKDYSLSGRQTVSFADIARILSDIRGVDIPYVPISDEEFTQGIIEGGRSRPLAEFVASWVRAINDGEWETPTSDLETLIGRQPVTVAQYLRTNRP